MNIIFLDIDGVLNSRKFIKQCIANNIPADDVIDPIAVARLNKITDATDAKLVISSTWRLPFLWLNDFKGLCALLHSHKITADVVGMTPDLNLDHGRGIEIQKYIDECGFNINKFIILDDDNDMNHLSNRLIKTNFDRGLLDKHINKCIKEFK